MPFGIKYEVEKRREPNKKILLVCEGSRTETEYFSEISKRNKSVLIVMCGYTSITKDNKLTKMVSDSCTEQGVDIFPSDVRCYIFDLDVFKSNPRLKDYIVTSSNTESFNMYYTFPSFEYWLLMSFVTSSNLESTLNLGISEIKNKLKEDYKFIFKDGKGIPKGKIDELIKKVLMLQKIHVQLKKL